MKNRPIGIFDSGFGGLSITKQLRKLFPNEEFIYVADTKYVPYGVKTKEEIKGYVTRISSYLVGRDVKAIIIACNTATANATHLDLDIPVIGMIEPTSKEASEATKNNNVLVLATQATVDSNLYANYLEKHNIKPYQQPAPKLVELVENMDIDTKNSHQVVLETLSPYIGKDLDTVVLGCTHYGFLRKEINSVLPNVKLVDGANEVGKILKESLEKSNTLKTSGKGNLTILTTGNFKKFQKDVLTLGINFSDLFKLNI